MFSRTFNVATLEIDNLDESVKYTAFLRGLRPTSKFAFSVNKSPLGNMKALLEKANKYIQAEEYLETHRGQRGERKEEQKKRSQELTPQGGKPTKRPKSDEQRSKDPFASENLTPLNAKLSQILHEIKDNKALQWPYKMRSRPNKRNKDMMKFPMEHGIGEVKGDQITARQCYVTSCRSRKHSLEDTKMQRGEPVENLVSIEVYPGEENKIVRIGSNLKEDTNLELVNLLRTYADVFAWTAADMPGIDPKTDDCQKSFEELKTYLSSPPLLSKQFPREDLFLYLSVTEVAVSAVLVREEDGVQKPIYYVSKVLQDVKTRYPKIDRIALALIISARRLRPYFQSHSIIILTDQPLRKVLLSPEASGRLVNWSVELGEFDIQYKPCTTIKAQALAYFIVECTLPENPPQLVISEVADPWNLYVDGSSAVGSSGSGIILISPEGFTIEYALRFGFQASNNEAEYEAFLARIRLAHALKVDSLSVYSDSQLVVNHVLGDYEARDERMAQYLELVKTSAVQFRNFTIHQIPRDQNTQADTLSRLASTEATDVRRSVYLEFLKEYQFSNWDWNDRSRTLLDGHDHQILFHRFTSVAHPQSNGQTENMNRSILQGLKKKLDEAKGAWVDELPKVLWAYRTTPHLVTGKMPFLLCYGTEAMLPIEIGVPTIWALHCKEVNNEVGLRANLDLIEEARTQAHERSVVIKQRVVRYYNQRVRSKQFKEGDLVLRKLEVSDPKAVMGKLSLNWKGPYRVIKVLKPGAYTLGTLSG
ncbi:hypothetical protein RJ639_030716 [Escallonia herrerae]|uniref:RNase H type-1 domain-containing protein n=1 Tax=Escallonia herrerae TaxID=1293975 RepID=A0AA88X0S7_9ASTE|nr:hypothetical protein RJ639_030716 [Escallonia herrerae]